MNYVEDTKIGTSYTITSSRGNKTGRSGDVVSLEVGVYTIELGSEGKAVSIVSNERKTLEFRSNLGSFKALWKCGDSNMMIIISDSTNKTVATSPISKTIELPAGKYSVMLSGYPNLLPPIDFEVQNNSIKEIPFGVFGKVKIVAKDATDRKINLPLEIYNNSQTGSIPIATGQTEEVFELPEGRYNVKVSPSSELAEQMKGGANIDVVACKQVEVSLKQEACLLIQSSSEGTITIYENSSNKTYQGVSGKCTGLPKGLYNIRCPDGSMQPNIQVNEGQNNIACP